MTRKCWVFSGKCFRHSGAKERSLWRFGFTAHSLKSELGWLSYCIRLFVSCRVSAWWTYPIFPNICLNFVDLKKLSFLFFPQRSSWEGHWNANDLDYTLFFSNSARSCSALAVSNISAGCQNLCYSSLLIFQFHLTQVIGINAALGTFYNDLCVRFLALSMKSMHRQWNTTLVFL